MTIGHNLIAAALLGAATALATTAADAAAMCKLPVDNFMTDHARIREDGQLMRNMYLVQVKSPAESHEPWDYERGVATIPPEEAWRPLAEGGSDLVKGAAQ